MDKKRARWLMGSLAAVVLLAVGGGAYITLRHADTPATSATPELTSGACVECHPNFHQLWSTSRHGTAMQPYTAALARREFTAASRPIRVGGTVYQADVSAGCVREDGPEGKKSYPIAHVMGGKNVYYLLTPWQRGRLQVLPVAYDVRRKEWYDTAASAVRHFATAADEMLDWRDPLYTFNTSCFGCHVSQMVSNYNVDDDTYHTTWKEPGINCQTCHGPSEEHVALCRKLPPGQKPADPKIVRLSLLTPSQQSEACLGCHAKAGSITPTFPPGGKFFDHFDLALYENADYYPDGRDLGENYTCTSWRRNPCAQSGKLGCLHCHTSSGRYRFEGAKANNACLPCHAQRVANPAPHTHHKADGSGSRCVGCHMPTTEFARMLRSDHSMRPPAPAATPTFKSPNACNICHADKDANWSDRFVRQWHGGDYQAPVLQRGRLVEEARRGDWTHLAEMLGEITRTDRDELFAASLARMVGYCPDANRIEPLTRALKDASPLVRTSAAMAMAQRPDARFLPGLVAATADDYRLVRIRAAGALAGYDMSSLNPNEIQRVSSAMREQEASLRVRPDDWASQYNLGNFLSDTGRMEEAARAYSLAAKFRPSAVMPLVNAAIVYARLGQTQQAERALVRAVDMEPNNAAAQFNMGLLRAEQNQMAQAQEHLRRALQTEPNMSQAAYNLSLMIFSEKPEEAIELCRRAVQNSPAEPRYAYTLAHLLNQAGQSSQAMQQLQALIARNADYMDSYHLLCELYVRAGRRDDAAALCMKVLARENLAPQDRRAFQLRLQRLQASPGGK